MIVCSASPANQPTTQNQSNLYPHLTNVPCGSGGGRTMRNLVLVMSYFYDPIDIEFIQHSPRHTIRHRCRHHRHERELTKNRHREARVEEWWVSVMGGWVGGEYKWWHWMGGWLWCCLVFLSIAPLLLFIITSSVSMACIYKSRTSERTNELSPPVHFDPSASHWASYPTSQPPQSTCI